MNPNRQILLPTTMTQDSLPIGPNLRISHLNIEGITASKSEYLARLMRDKEIDIIALQKTHSTSDTSLINRSEIPYYKLIGAIHRNVHGIATYARVSLNNCFITHSDCTNNIPVLAVEVSGISIVNVYKPPSVNWLNNILEKLPHPAIYAGDFNSHNQAWRYEHNDIDENRLMEWTTLYKIHLIYHPKDIGTFRSER
jgi:exonuclease III